MVIVMAIVQLYKVIEKLGEIFYDYYTQLMLNFILYKDQQMTKE